MEMTRGHGPVTIGQAGGVWLFQLNTNKQRGYPRPFVFFQLPNGLLISVSQVDFLIKKTMFRAFNIKFSDDLLVS